MLVCQSPVVEIREYFLEKWGRECIYCGVKDVQLEIEHIAPKSKGGSDRVSNLTLACNDCNQRKGNMDISDFLDYKGCEVLINNEKVSVPTMRSISFAYRADGCDYKFAHV